MPIPSAFYPPGSFLKDVLPGLVPNAPAFTNIVASCHAVGFPRSSKPLEIEREDGLVTLVFHDLDAGRLASEVCPTIDKETRSEAPALVTIYVSPRMFTATLQLLADIRRVRPQATVVTFSCCHLTEQQEDVLQKGVESGKIGYAVWCECGGSQNTNDVRVAVKKNWTPVRTDAHISPSANSADLGA